MTADKNKTFDISKSQEEVEINMNTIFEIKRMRFDMLFSSMMYPADYGFIQKH
jgi:inorganic pyrophosphatase